MIIDTKKMNQNNSLDQSVVNADIRNCITKVNQQIKNPTKHLKVFSLEQMIKGKEKIFNQKNTSTNCKSFQCGYGSCYKCYCQAFEGNGQQCSNCGHSYYDHW